MQITERDKEIVKFLAKFGFARADQVGKYLGASEFVAWRRMKKLAEEGYLRRERIFHGQPGVYLATRVGLGLIGCERKNVKPINVATYDHDLIVLDISIYYHHQGYGITSEKELRQGTAGQIGERGTRERTPDLVLKKNGKVVAVEFENSPKSMDRMTKILRFFGRSRKYDECWFFCSSEALKSRWEKIGAGKNSRIKLEIWEGGKKDARTRTATGS